MVDITVVEMAVLRGKGGKCGICTAKGQNKLTNLTQKVDLRCGWKWLWRAICAFLFFVNG